MAEQAKIQTLHDHDTGEAIAPRTDVKAISGKGKKWNYVGFTDDNVVGLIEGTWPCNRNLLDNPDYTHPVNQRNANKYESNGYTIDRWILLSFGNPSRLEVQEGYITLSNAALRQNMDVIAGEYFGRTMTFSTLYADNTLHSITGEIPKNTGSSHNYYFNGAMDDGCNVQFGYYDALVDLKFFALINTMGQEKSIKAVKLEVGSTQTLAHKEGDTWVLNEIPDYATELAKCQGYQVIENVPVNFAVAYTNETAGGLTVFLPLSTTLRSNGVFKAKRFGISGNGKTISMDNVSSVCINQNNGVWFGVTADCQEIGALESVVCTAYDGYEIDCNL